MVQITRENKRKVYAYLLEEGVIVVKKVSKNSSNIKLRRISRAWTIWTRRCQTCTCGCWCDPWSRRAWLKKCSTGDTTTSTWSPKDWKCSETPSESSRRTSSPSPSRRPKKTILERKKVRQLPGYEWII